MQIKIREHSAAWKGAHFYDNDSQGIFCVHFCEFSCSNLLVCSKKKSLQFMFHYRGDVAIMGERLKALSKRRGCSRDNEE
jgi:hypothetical protein